MSEARGHAHRRASFADAELAEDRVEQILGRRLADDFADGVDGEAQVERDEFERGVGAQGLGAA